MHITDKRQTYAILIFHGEFAQPFFARTQAFIKESYIAQLIFLFCDRQLLYYMFNAAASDIPAFILIQLL
jgi:hypothetical protein